MHYYLKTFRKNSGAWIKPMMKNETGEVPAFVSTAGWTPVNDIRYDYLFVPDGVHFFRCWLERFRIGNGNPDPDGKRGFTKANFSIIAVPVRDNFGNQQQVTPQIDFNAKWYGDEMNYTFIIDTGLAVDDLLKRNVELYNEWLQYHNG